MYLSKTLLKLMIVFSPLASASAQSCAANATPRTFYVSAPPSSSATKPGYVNLIPAVPNQIVHVCGLSFGYNGLVKSQLTYTLGANTPVAFGPAWNTAGTNATLDGSVVQSAAGSSVSVSLNAVVRGGFTLIYYTTVVTH